MVPMVPTAYVKAVIEELVKYIRSMNRNVVYTITLLFHSTFLLSQNGVSNWQQVAFDKTKNDSVRLNEINRLVNHYNEAIEYDSVIYYLDYGLSIAEKDKALSNLELELELKKSWIYIQQRRFYDANESTRRLIAQSREAKNNDFISKGYLNLSSTYAQLEENVEAQKYMDSLLEMINTLDEFTQVEVYGLQGQINIGEKNYKEALKNLFYAKNKTKTLKVYSAPIDLTLGECYLELNMLDSALYYVQTAYNKGTRLNDKADAAIFFAELLVRKNENDKAVDLLVESINLSKQLGSYYNLKKAAEILISLKDELNGKISLIELYDIYTEALYQANSQDKVKEFYKSEYELKVLANEAKAKEVVLRNELEQKEIQSVNERKQIILIVIFTIVIITLFFVYRIRVRSREYQLNLSLQEIDFLKEKIAARNFLENKANTDVVMSIDRSAIEKQLNGKLNETDWNILKHLVDQPTLTNQELADRVFLSYEGVRSALKRLYGLFDLSDKPGNKSLRMKLILEALSCSNKE